MPFDFIFFCQRDNNWNNPNLSNGFFASHLMRCKKSGNHKYAHQNCQRDVHCYLFSVYTFFVRINCCRQCVFFFSSNVVEMWTKKMQYVFHVNLTWHLRYTRSKKWLTENFVSKISNAIILFNFLSQVIFFFVGFSSLSASMLDNLAKCGIFNSWSSAASTFFRRHL